MRHLKSLAFALVVWISCIGWCAADEPPARKEPARGDPFAGLLDAIKATPGCLGVETAQTSSGKNVVFAWFEDRKAALAWYNSDTHQELMAKFFPKGRSDRKPLADVPDDSGPIMAVASLTLTGKPSKDNPLPFKQIAIELYQPVGGGIAIGGKFSPDKMKVPSRTGKPKPRP